MILKSIWSMQKTLTFFHWKSQKKQLNLEEEDVDEVYKPREATAVKLISIPSGTDTTSPTGMVYFKICHISDSNYKHMPTHWAHLKISLVW